MRAAHPEAQVEVWATDEHRVGLKPIVRRLWARRGQRPLVRVQHRYQWLYLLAFVHPASGRSVYLKTGRFGPYFQLGDDLPPKPKRKKGDPKPPKVDPADEPPKPKRASLPRGEDPATVSLERAMQFLSLPREVGLHPETGTPIVANLGRFGPYVTDGTTNATVQNSDDPESVTLEQALALIADRAAKGGGKKKKPAKKAAAVKPKKETKAKPAPKAKAEKAATPVKKKAPAKKKPEPVAGE